MNQSSPWWLSSLCVSLLMPLGGAITQRRMKLAD